MTQPDYWSTLPPPAAPPLVTVTSPSLSLQPEHRPFYRRPLFLILVSLAVLAVVAVLFGTFGSVRVSSPLHVSSPVQVSDSFTAKLNATWDATTPEDRAQGCMAANLIGIDNVSNLATPDNGAPLTADQRVKFASFLRAHCK